MSNYICIKVLTREQGPRVTNESDTLRCYDLFYTCETKYCQVPGLRVRTNAAGEVYYELGKGAMSQWEGWITDYFRDEYPGGKGALSTFGEIVQSVPEWDGVNQVKLNGCDFDVSRIPCTSDNTRKQCKICYPKNVVCGEHGCFIPHILGTELGCPDLDEYCKGDSNSNDDPVSPIYPAPPAD